MTALLEYLNLLLIHVVFHSRITFSTNPKLADEQIFLQLGILVHTYMRTGTF